MDENFLAEELKHSCTNVMLQCLDPESRMIYVLGVMFKVDSKIGGEILKISPEAYRQRLSRIRKQVGAFLSEYCGLSQTGKCNCKKRVGYAIQTNRLNPENLEYNNMQKISENTILDLTQAMDELDEISLIFAKLPKYQSPDVIHKFIKNLLDTKAMKAISQNA